MNTDRPRLPDREPYEYGQPPAKRTITIPPYAITFGCLLGLAYVASPWFWYRVLFAALFLHGFVLGHGFLKAYREKR